MLSRSWSLLGKRLFFLGQVVSIELLGSHSLDSTLSSTM